MFKCLDETKNKGAGLIGMVAGDGVAVKFENCLYLAQAAESDLIKPAAIFRAGFA